MNKAQRFCQLNLKDKTVLCKAVILLVVVRTLLRITGLRTTQQVLGQVIRDSRSYHGDKYRVTRYYADLINIASRRGFIKANCLERSVVLYFILKRMGVSGRLRFGSKLINRSLEAHAWVEIEGTVVNDMSCVSDTYRPFDRDIDFLQMNT